MSTCISRHGEFGSHTLDDSYTCTLCHVLDEDAMRAELKQMRSELAEAERHIERGNDETMKAYRLARTLPEQVLLWAADELDAQARARNENLTDYTDHLRCFTEQPDRASIVPRPVAEVSDGN